ncbi:MAG TPA: UDP-N-acetylmuramate dehydrogenase [Patescibacteria group bacterium]
MITVQENITLAPLTSFRIGGEARFYVEVKSVEELREALDFAKEKKLDFYVLGGGTNLLVSDKGFAGIIIRMKINEICADDETLTVSAGVPLIKAINVSAAEELAGLEPLAGIPGTVGGAVRGNAGAFGSEIAKFIQSVKALNSKTGEMEIFDAAQCDFSYRSSIFKKNKDYIVISVTLKLQKGSQEEIQKKISETVAKRTSRGLHGVKSAGSFFMNPVVSDPELCALFEKENGVAQKDDKLPAGWVIDQADLRGKKIGGAQISELHANYIINADNATAEDVIMLVSFVKQQVRDKFGVQLNEEVNYLGF